MSNRWWIYQKQRFPIFRHALMAAIFSASAIGYSLSVRSATDQATASIGIMLLATLSVFLFDLQLQIIDEFQDLQTDILQRPHLPVPSGIVKLSELQILGLAAGCIQFGLALPIGFSLLLFLAGLWLYLGLLSRNFFRKSLSPFLKALSRVIFTGLLAIYATAHDWLRIGFSFNLNLGWFLLISLLAGLAIELSRTMKTIPLNPIQPDSVQRKNRWLSWIWLITVWLLTLATFQAGAAIQFVIPVIVISLLLLLISVAAAWRFWQRPTARSTHSISLISDLWAIGIYFNIGILPLLLAK